MKQLQMKFRTWGGKRRGAGRKPKGARAGVPHVARPALGKPRPVHVTVRVLPHVWNLRSRRSFAVIGPAIYAAGERFGVRVCHYSVQGNHVHLVAEAGHAADLGRAMKGFGVRVAKGLNRMMDRRGRVLADRYHEHVLRTPTEMRHAVHYVIHNYRRHALERRQVLPPTFVDPFSSASGAIALPAPSIWLLGQVARASRSASAAGRRR
jgi:REP-associated tyrosine transposase